MKIDFQLFNTEIINGTKSKLYPNEYPNKSNSQKSFIPVLAQPMKLTDMFSYPFRIPHLMEQLITIERFQHQVTRSATKHEIMKL